MVAVAPQTITIHLSPEEIETVAPSVQRAVESGIDQLTKAEGTKAGYLTHMKHCDDPGCGINNKLVEAQDKLIAELNASIKMLKQIRSQL